MEILFEDNHIIVVQKPQNVLSQGDETGDQDMLGMVKNYIKEKYRVTGEFFNKKRVFRSKIINGSIFV